MEVCQKCHDHNDEDLCKKCYTCRKEHYHKYGLKWLKNQEARSKNKPCIHKCYFTLPNNQKVEYQCTGFLGHEGVCNFPVNKEILEKMAKRSGGQ